MIYLIILPVLIGLANAISELSNHGKLIGGAGWSDWWNETSWRNKNKWKPVLGFIKWSWWPMIIFTDAFHFFKTLWVITMCFLPMIEPFSLIVALEIFSIYSFSFSVFYFVFPFLKLK